MPISEMASLVGGAALGAPFSEILKLVIEWAKNAKDFKPLFEDLVSTMERRLPILQEIYFLEEGLDPAGEGELNFLRVTMLRALELALKCSCVRRYSVAEKAQYTKEIKGINEDFVNFCQVDLPLIQHRNQLRSRFSLNIEEESPPPPPHRLEEGNSSISTRASSLDEDEQRIIWESLKEKDNRRQVKEDEQVAAGVQESLIIEESRRLEEGNSSISTRASLLDEDEQRIIWESFEERGNGRQVNKFKFKQVAAAVQESLIIINNGKQAKEDEQLAAGFQESLLIEESRRLEEGNSSISTRASSLDEDEQLEKVIRESLKELK